MVGSFLLFFNSIACADDIGYADPGSDGGLEENLASRGYRSILADDDYDSEEY